MRRGSEGIEERKGVRIGGMLAVYGEAEEGGSTVRLAGKGIEDRRNVNCLWKD